MIEYMMLVAVAVTLITLGAVFVWKLRQNNWEHKTDYKTLFNIGTIWLIFGIIMNLSIFYILGIAFLSAGLLHKKEWG